MKEILHWLRAYFSDPRQRKAAFLSLAFCLALITVNYSLYSLHRFQAQAWYLQLLLYAAVSGSGLLIARIAGVADAVQIKRFFPWLLLALLVYALRGWPSQLSWDYGLTSSADETRMLKAVVIYPLRVLVLLLLLFMIRHGLRKDLDSLYGLTLRGHHWRPYLLMLMIVAPLIALAATQPDFQHSYPRWGYAYRCCDALLGWKWYLAYDLCYLTDFIGVELFFRGFLVLGMWRFLGPAAIWPASCWYVAIHFGKPAGECFSSFFGGTVLGIIAANTRSIFGGIAIHTGIAALMELAGLWALLA